MESTKIHIIIAYHFNYRAVNNTKSFESDRKSETKVTSNVVCYSVMYVRLVDGLLATITPTTTNTTTQRHNFVVVVGLIYFVITVIGGILMKSIMNFFIFKLVILLCMITDSYYVMAASRLRFERFPLRSKNDKDDPNKGFSAFPLKTEDENKRNGPELKRRLFFTFTKVKDFVAFRTKLPETASIRTWCLTQ